MIAATRRIAAVLFGAAAAIGPAAAQDIPVRTGEHSGFTRIVLDFATLPDWRFGRVGQRHELRVDDPSIGFDLSDAFRRIRNDRIADLVDLGGGRLSLELACACALSVEPLPNNGLMIDVRDGPPEPGSPWEQALDAAASPPAEDTVRPPDPVLPVLLADPPAQLMLGPLAGGWSSEDLGQLARPRELHTNLVEQLARAASQGLIALDAPVPQAPLRDQQEDVPEQAPQESPVLDVRIGRPPNMLIETQIDRDNRSAAGQRPRDLPVDCFEAARIDVGNWFADGTVQDQLGAARQNLVDSRDRPDPSAYSDLARRLIYLSFGAEARALLRGGPENIPDGDLLIELATLMEADGPVAGGMMQTQLACDSPSALWGVLATDPGMPLRGVNSEAVVQSVSALPSHLRQYLGPRVAARLMEGGHREAALLIRNALQRGMAEPTSALTMIDAEIDLSAGRTEEAEAKLALVATSRSAQAADALATMIETRLAEDRAVDENLLSQAAALAFETDGEDTARRLNSAIIRAHVQGAAYQAAFDRIAETRDTTGLDSATGDALRDDALLSLAATASDAEFLKLALAQSAVAPIRDPARVPVAARLVKLGMVGPARAVLGSHADIPGQQERYVLAEIAILEGKRSIAEGYLAGLESETARVLRNRATGIGTAPPEVETTEPAAAWTAPEEQPVLTEGVLSRNRDLLSESRSVRDSLSALLQSSGE